MSPKNNESKKNIENVVIFPTNPKSKLNISDDGKSCLVVQEYPGQDKKTLEVHIKVDENILKKFNITYKNVIGKVLSVLSRAKQGTSYYADKPLGIILEIKRKNDYFEVSNITPFNFYNEKGLDIEIINDITD